MSAILIQAKDGRQYNLRLLEASDSEAFGEFLQTLSPATTRRFGPHPLTPQHATILCQGLKQDSAQRWVIEDKGIIAGYFILEHNISEDEAKRYSAQGVSLVSPLDVIFAPCIADAYQNLGLASAAIRPLMQQLKQQGARSMVLMGGTQATNQRARHFYQACGFVEYGRFNTELENIDMRAIL
ncbi:N-acetyltransferase family protein [Agarivorans sp. MS3-6]